MDLYSILTSPRTLSALTQQRGERLGHQEQLKRLERLRKPLKASDDDLSRIPF